MSGWTTVTAMANSAEDAEALADAFESVVEDAGRDIHVQDERVEVLDWGYGASGSHRVLKQNTGLWSEAIVMECNDTTDAGDGSYYTSDGGSMEKQASATGYEGAHGRDAAGKLREEAGFSAFMR